MKLTIFHLSDSHWIPEHDDVDNSKKRPQSEQTEFYRGYKKCLERLPLASYVGNKQQGDVSMVVHTGDLANRYPHTKRSDGCDHIELEKQFAHIKANHIDHLTRLFGPEHVNVDYFLAVPGNHDLDEADRRKLEAYRFRHFIEAFKGWKTPFPETLKDMKPPGWESPLLRIPIEGMPGKYVTLIPFNSASDVFEADDEEGDGKPVPSAAVNYDHIEVESSDHLRIAVLHHNILPQYGQRDKRVRKDIFTNNGNFNAFLVENNFKLILSGHQHLPNDSYFSRSTCLFEGSDIHSPFDAFLLSLSAPSLLRREIATTPGFNIVQITLSPQSNIATVVVTKYRFGRDDRDFGHNPEKITHHVLIPRLGVVGSTLEQSRRLETMLNTIDRLYDPAFPAGDMDRIAQLVSLRKETNHFQRIKKTLQANYRADEQNIFGMYSVALLPPQTWMDHQALFGQIFENHYQVALNRANRDADVQPLSLSFHFSPPLCEAIRTSLANASSFDIFERFTRQPTLGFDLKISDRVVKRPGSSLSNWKRTRIKQEIIPVGSGADVQALEVGDIAIEGGAGVMHMYSPEVVKAPDFEFYELARILVWSPEVFLSDAAAAYVNIHENALVPLFWLDPERLKGQSLGLRKDIGYLVIYMKRFQDYRFREEPIDLSIPLSFFNNVNSETVTPDERLDIFLWGHQAPEYFRRNSNYVTEEFSMLLRRPDIMLAVDALALTRLTSPQDIRRLLAEQFDTPQVPTING